MEREPEERIRGLRDTALLSGFLGLALGYVVFYGIYPTLSVPAAPQPDFGYQLLILGVAATLAGLATERLAMGIVQDLLGVVLGGAVATAMLMSPALTGVVLAGAVDIPFYMVHYGFPFLLLGFITNLVFGTVGLGLRELVLLRYRYDLPPSWARNRK